MSGGTAEARAGAPSIDPPAGHFGFMFIVDEWGTFICGVHSDFRPIKANSIPANARGAASFFATSGTVPPRSLRRTPLAEGVLVVAAGDVCLLALMLPRPATPADESRAMAAVLAFEAQNAHHLSADAPRDATWSNGAAATLRSAWNTPLSTLPARPPSTAVYAHAVATPRGASLMLQLFLHNEGVAPARRVEVRFESPRDFLRPAAVYGEGAILGGATLRLLEPLERGVRTLDVHFLPVEARQGPLSITMSYTTAGGQVVQVPARRVAVRIDMPRITAPHDKSAESIKSFLRRQGVARDGWRIFVRPHVTARFAFERAKEVIERDGPAKVMELASVHPPHFEAWYFAQVKGSGRQVFVEVSVHARSRVLEIRAATEAGPDLIGAVAEYRRRLRELLSDRFMRRAGNMVLIDAAPRRLEDAPPELHAALLFRHMEGEISAQELDDEIRRAALREGDDALGILEAFEVEDEAEGPPVQAPAELNLAGQSAGFELHAGLLDSWAPIVARFATDEALVLPGPIARRRQQYDRSSDMEISDFDAAEWGQ